MFSLQGGSTLGMSWNHSHIRKFSLGEHAAEQRKAHRQLCSQQLDSTRSWNESSNISSEDSDSDEVASDSEVDYENYNFLQVNNSTIVANFGMGKFPVQIERSA